MSLRDGSAKMSKSDPSDMSRINLTDDDDAIAQKIRKAQHRSRALARGSRPARRAARGANLVGVLAALTDESEAAVCARFAGQGFGAFKPALADALVALLSPLRARLVELRRDEAQIDAFLAAGRRTRRRAGRADARRRLSRGRPARLSDGTLASSTIQHGWCYKRLLIRYFLSQGVSRYA